MATFQVSLSGSNVVNGSKSWTISDADVQKLVNYLTEKFTERDQFLVPQPPTPQQAMNRWITDFVSRTIAEVKARDLNAARDAVIVPELVFT